MIKAIILCLVLCPSAAVGLYALNSYVVRRWFR